MTAERELRAGYDGLYRTLDPSNARVIQARDRLVAFYRARGRAADAHLAEVELPMAH